MRFRFFFQSSMEKFVYYIFGVGITDGIDAFRMTIRDIFLYSNLHVSSWFLVALTIERLVAITIPHRVKLFCTVGRARLTVLAIILSVFSINIFCWTVLVEDKIHPIFGPLIFDRIPGGYFFFLGIEVAMSFAVPVCILLPCTLMISFSLLRNTFQKSALSKERAISVTRNLIGANIVFILTVSPFRIYTLMHINTEYSEGNFDFFYVSTYVYELNTVLNFYIYFVSGSRFRSDLKDILCGKRLLRRGTSISRSSTMTTVSGSSVKSPAKNN